MSASKKKQERRAAMLADGSLTEKQKREQKEAQVQKRNRILIIIAALVAVVLIVLLLVWRSGFFARHSVALTVKDHSYSVADMDYYYHQAINNAYAQEQQWAAYYAQLGVEYPYSVDYSGDLRTQYVDEEKTQSYHDYFLETAKNNAAETAAMLDAAAAEGFTLSAEAQTQLDESLASMDQVVSQYNYGSRTAYLKAVYGQNMTEDVYIKNVTESTLAYEFYSSKMESFGNYSDADLDAYYSSNPDQLDGYTFNAAYLDGTAPSTQDADGKTVAATDEAKAAAMAEAKKDAEDLMAAVLAGPAPEAPAAPEQPAEGDATPAEGDATPAEGDATPAEGEGESQPEEAPEEEPDEYAYFGTVAADFISSGSTRRTNIMGSNLTSSVYGEWLMDSARKPGDIDIFEVTDAGYYVVQFISRARDDTPTADVRHILFLTALEDDPATEDVDESQQDPSEEHIQEVHDKAQALLDEFLAGEITGDAFGKLADQHSEDSRDSNNDLYAPGGLYEKISPDSNYVQPWLDWIFADGRKVGDTGIVQTTYGWYIMYFQAYNEPTWKSKAESLKTTDDQNAWVENIKAGYEAVEGSSFGSVGKS